MSEEDAEDTKLSLITWNVDGLDGEEQPERARGLCAELSRSPAVHFKFRFLADPVHCSVAPPGGEALFLCCLHRYSPDVVFLQELVQPYVRFLHKRLSDVYTYIEGV